MDHKLSQAMNKLKTTLGPIPRASWHRPETRRHPLNQGDQV
ncbi:unnamed protein product [Penicillium camemberti]|uniref:Str. FM013 n=1 Tax=Penicillium camemberti (strain FM 013) TaxID=1429867 RepID=A0A0G4PGS0_PENC3|nr:unnamed protein product [Penicillium camemberti]